MTQKSWRPSTPTPLPCHTAIAVSSLFPLVCPAPRSLSATVAPLHRRHRVREAPPPTDPCLRSRPPPPTQRRSDRESPSCCRPLSRSRHPLPILGAPARATHRDASDHAAPTPRLFTHALFGDATTIRQTTAKRRPCKHRAGKIRRHACAHHQRRKSPPPTALLPPSPAAAAAASRVTDCAARATTLPFPAGCRARAPARHPRRRHRERTVPAVEPPPPLLWN